MTHSIAFRPAAPQGSAEMIAGLLETATADLEERLVSVEPGRLVSLGIDLPVWAIPALAGLAGDSRWLGSADGTFLYGAGTAACVETADIGRFRVECAGWAHFGDVATAPLFFFTAPPATRPGGFTLRLPQVVLRRGPARATLIVSARRDATPIGVVIDRWLAAIRSLVASQNDAMTPRLIRQSVCTPGIEQWADRVRAATAAIGRGEFAKVVLARRMRALLADDLDANDLADRLAIAYPECCVFSFPYGDGRVVAASPERLAIKRASQVVSHALAGTAARGEDGEADARAAATLLASAKERREHAVVVEAIAAGMAELCDTVAHAPEPTVMRLRRVQHLWTPVSGQLRAGLGLLDVVARLHPTPAVLGFPRQAAMAWLQRVEEARCGLYTGVAGWIDRDGNGDAAVVLRSAHLDGRTATLWAGAGIMAESDPDAELAETDLKLATMLDLLGAA